MRARIQPGFDPKGQYFARRPFRFGGKAVVAGEPFEVTGRERRAAMLFALRMIVTGAVVPCGNRRPQEQGQEQEELPPVDSASTEPLPEPPAELPPETVATAEPPAQEPAAAPARARGKVVQRCLGWWDVVDEEGHIVNARALRRKEAEELAGG